MAHGPPAKRNSKLNGDVGENDEDETQLPVPPDGGWGWMVVLASFAIHIVTDGMTYSFGIFYVEFLEYFKEGKGYTAWIASILVGVTLCSGPISSALVNRYGCRAVTIAGSILAGICLMLSVFAESVFVLFITIGLGGGLGFGLIYLPAIVSVTMYFERLRSLATGIAVCGSGFGTFLFAPLTEHLIGNYGWRGALLIIAGIVFNCAIFGAMFRPLEHPKKIKQHSNEYNTETGNGGTSNHSINMISSNQSIPRSQSIGHSYKNGMSSNKTKSGEALSKKLSVGEDSIRLTLSQPLLNVPEDGSSNLKRAESGTMYRPDALYTGSIHNIAKMRSSRGDVSDSDRYGSLRTNGSHAKNGNIVANHQQNDAQIMCGCIPCSKETKDTFSEMMNFSLFQDPIFIVFTISNFLTSIGFNVPYVYLAAQADFLKISKENASYLLAIIGIANTVGRIILGYISDKPWVNRLMVYNICLTTCGIATIGSIWCVDFYSLATYSAVFGFTIGAYVGLTSVILVDLLGLDKLTNAFGLLLLFQGIASLVGPPMAGTLYDLTSSYNPGFILAGVTIAASGVMLTAIPPMKRHYARKLLRANGGNQMVPL